MYMADASDRIQHAPDLDGNSKWKLNPFWAMSPP